MLIDSGASWTSISPTVAAQLNLPVLGLRPLTSVTHAATVREYLADVYFPIPGGQASMHLKDLRLLEFPMAGSNLDGLLGRDLLQHTLFQFNGPAREWTLAF